MVVKATPYASCFPELPMLSNTTASRHQTQIKLASSQQQLQHIQNYAAATRATMPAQTTHTQQSYEAHVPVNV
jgi:hypothetical protein